MFRNRTSSQKPGDELYANFRQHFPELSGSGASPGNEPGDNSLGDVSAGESSESDRNHSLSHGEMNEIKDHNPTPGGSHEPWRFTPSILDSNSFSFTNFTNQPPGYYTPTPGGTNTLYHSQAGDLHTPGMGAGMGLGTPLSIPTSEAGVHASALLDMSSFTNSMAPHPFQNYNPFAQQSHHLSHHQHAQTQQQTFAPSSFVHQDTGYETMEHDGSPMDDDERLGSMDSTLHNQSPLMNFQPRHYDMDIGAATMPFVTEKFRFHSTLNAPTAMIKHAEEIPVTYLNKGQAYSLSIVDSSPSMPLLPGAKYRTFVRVSFEDEEQRSRPAFCWGLWKEGRGTNEAHQRGGKLQAVEYVESTQPSDINDRRARVELDTASFDGFSVTWTPSSVGQADCTLAVRFNFLSTDFSHSKGVKGIPVRLCTKTELVSPSVESPHSHNEVAEVAFCKVKLFRDHGAERKLSNDIAHVKKTIDKLKQQITQSETGMKDFGKRKRTGSVANKAQASQRPGKVQKHKRTWSISSASSSGGGRAPLEEDLHFKLRTMQDMFTSTRPVSVLYLRGAEQDDPDLHPVTLAGEPIDITKADSKDSALWQQRSGRSSAADSSLVSPASSSVSGVSQALTSTACAAPSQQWPESQPMASTERQISSEVHHFASGSNPPTKIEKTDDGGNFIGWIEALGVDASYNPPPERTIKPIACFYVRNTSANEVMGKYYRAIYLMQRTLKDFTSSIAVKCGLEPTKIVRTLRVVQDRLEVEVDDDVIRELGEGQDMLIEIVKIKNLPTSQPKREWDLSSDEDVIVDSNDGLAGQSAQNVVHTDGFELRLRF